MTTIVITSKTLKLCKHSKLVQGFFPIRHVCNAKATLLVDGSPRCKRHAK